MLEVTVSCRARKLTQKEQMDSPVIYRDYKLLSSRARFILRKEERKTRLHICADWLMLIYNVKETISNLILQTLSPLYWHSTNTYLSSLGMLGTEPDYFPT